MFAGTAWKAGHSINVLVKVHSRGVGIEPASGRPYDANECAVAVELQTCDPADVPRTRAGIREYFERARPNLVGSEMARHAMNHLLRSRVMLTDLPPGLHFVAKVTSVFIDRATVATMPHWIRERVSSLA